MFPRIFEIPYTTEHIIGTFNSGRQAKGLIQRTLGKKVIAQQSQIWKTENGAFVLQVSSLVELARALNPELMLAPRKTIPAVQSTIRGYPERASPAHEPAPPGYSLDESEGGRG